MNAKPPAKPKLKQGLMLGLERFSRQHYLVVFVTFAVLTGLGAWLGSRLSIDSDILALIPEGNRQVDTFRDAVDRFGAISYLMVLVEAGDEHGPEALEDFADRLAQRLDERDDLVERIDYQFPPADDQQYLDLFYRNALLFLPPEQLPELRARLTDPAILDQLAEDRRMLSSPMGIFALELIENDPLALMPVFLKRLLGRRGFLEVDLSDGYYLSRDGRNLIMLIKPTQPWQALDFDERLMAEMHRIEQELRDELNEEGDAVTASVGVRYSGRYAMAVDEATLIREDIRWNLSASLIAVLALYFICYRRFAALLYSSVPLIVGQALTFGLAFVVLRSLNASSSAFTALLMGLGTDFVIVMYARYVEERRLGRTLAEATELMVGETGLGVFTGAVTSAGTFYAMCISEFRGLRDLGFLIGSGILLCAVAIVFLVPAMIKWNEGVRPRKGDSVRKLHVQSFLLEYLIVFSARYRVPVIIAIVLLTGGAGWLALNLEFDDTVNVLRSNNSPAYRVQQDITDRFGASLSYMMAIAEAPTTDEAIALTAKIEERLKPWVESGVVASYDSLLKYLPPREQQEQVLVALREDRRAFDPARVRATIEEGLRRNRFSDTAFAEFRDRLDHVLSPQRPLELDDFERHGLTDLVERYIAVEDGTVRSVTRMYLTAEEWKRDVPPGLVDALTADDPGIVVTGTNVVGTEFRRIFSREAPRAVMLGLFVVFVLLWLDFRSLRLTLIALSQLVCGVILMLGGMKLAGIHLNYVNAFVSTMILGVGIDYSIHLVHRMQWSGGRVEAGLLETGKAVVIAALTNIAAFGTLALGNYPALRSFGLVALFGSATCLFTALTLVPAMMARRHEP